MLSYCRSMMSQAARAPRLLLYKRDASPPSSAIMVLGEMLNLDFDYKDPDLLKLEHRTPEFKKLNPMATVPVLVDGDFVVSESHAIMQYLLSKYGGKHAEALYPSAPEKRAIIDQCMFFDAGVFFVALKSIALPIFLEGSTGPSEKSAEALERAFGVLEVYLQRNEFVAGDQMTIADLSVASTAASASYMIHVDPVKYPRCKEWLEKLSKLPTFTKVNTCAVLLTKALDFCAARNKEALANKS